MVEPYYEHNGITVYHGDCRDILPQLEPVDLVCTDPPYGISEKWQGGSGHGWKKARSQEQSTAGWDQCRPPKELLNSIIRLAGKVIIWGGNYFVLPPSRGWLVWNKPERGFTLAEAELAWTNQDTVVRVCDCHRSDKDRKHPTQKPLKLMQWCLSQKWTKDCKTILDPFMGSGTTLRAAKDLGRDAIGIELDERYCEIAAKRLSQEVLPF